MSEASKKNLSVRYRNELNRARTHLDVVEHRIIRCAMAQVVNGSARLSETQLFHVSASDLVDLGSDPQSVYRDMKEAAETLFNRYVTLKEVDADAHHWVRKFRYVSEVKYDDQEGRIALRFTYSIIPFIERLKDEFTQQGLLDTKGMRSAYAVRIYGILSQFKSTGKCSIGLKDLRERLDLGDRFKAYADFKRFILLKAIKQINEGERTVFRVSMREKKIGRRVDTLIFTLKPKEVPDMTNQAFVDAHTIDLASNLTPAQCQMTEKQAAMFADWLSANADKPGRGERIGCKDYAAVWSKLHKRGLNPRGGQSPGPGEFRNWLYQKLLDPSFVMEIYEDFLKPLGFQPGKP